MSRIGKNPVQVPKGVTVKIDGTTVTLKGPKGELKRKLHESLVIKQDGEKLVLTQKEQGDLKKAAATLHDFLARRPGFVDGYLLLAEIYRQQGEQDHAVAVLRQAVQRENLSPQDQARLTAAFQNLTGAQPTPR